MLALGLVAAAPPTRVHTATSARPLELLPATQTVSGSPELAIEVRMTKAQQLRAAAHWAS